jgi:hypothetical protein
MIRKIHLLMTCLLCAFFVIAPARGARSLIESRQSVEPDKVKFAVIGDTGTGERNQFGVAQSMDKVYEQEPFGFVLRKGDIKRDDPLLAAGNDEVCHFMLFDVEEDEARFRAIDINGAVIDQGVISAKPNVNGQ